jgi:hypothetical protein
MAAADAQPGTGAALRSLAENPFGGSVSFQPGSVDGQVTLDAGSVALKATLDDPGIDGQLHVIVPDHFVGTLSTANTGLSYDLSACAQGVNLGLSGTSISDVQLTFSDTASNPGVCSGAAPAAQAPLLMREMTFAAQAQQPAAQESDAQTLLVNWIRRVVGFSILAGVLILLIPGMPRSLSVATESSPWPRLGIGLALLLTVPLAGLLLFAIGLPIGLWWLGVIVLALYPVLLLVSLAVSGLALGTWLSQRAHQPGVPLLLMFAAGIVILSLLSLLPYIGPIVTIAALIFGLGLLVLAPRSAPPVAPAAASAYEAPPPQESSPPPAVPPEPVAA